MSSFVFRAPFPRGYTQNEPFAWTRPQIELLLAWSLAVDADTAARIPRLLARVADYTNSGISQASAGDRVSGGGRNDDGGRSKVLSMRKDPFAQAAQNIIICVAQMARLQEALLVELGRLESARPEDLKALMEDKPRAGSGYCSNPFCGQWCSGVSNDRIKGGRCPACATYRSNHGGEERPHDLCHTAGVGGCELCARAA